jgi:hypothetical protein
MVEVVAMIVEEVKVDLLQTLAELTSLPLLELLMLTSVNDTKRRHLASSVTRRVIVSSSARS